MATDLTTIFGNEICVAPQPRTIARRFTGFPGANGVTAMHLGTRGRPLVVTGNLRVAGSGYNDLRSMMELKIAEIDAYRYPAVDVASYTFKGSAYDNVIFDEPFTLIPDQFGRIYHLISNVEMTARFVCTLMQLL
jgi:hypothetical protein